MARWRDPIWASAEDVSRTEVDAQRWLDQALSLGCVSHFSGPMSLGAQRALRLDMSVRLPGSRKTCRERNANYERLLRVRGVQPVSASLSRSGLDHLRHEAHCADGDTLPQLSTQSTTEARVAMDGDVD